MAWIMPIRTWFPAPVTWTYVVQNTGNAALGNVTVSDSDPTVLPVLQDGGDSNGNGLLDVGETWVFTASGTAVAGQYINTGTATGTDVTGATRSRPAKAIRTSACSRAFRS